MKTMIVTYKLGVYNGKYIQFNETGVAVVDGQYVNDKKDGEWLYRQRDSRVIRKENYKEGKPSGTWTEYYENGNLRQQKSYNKKGKLEGKFIKQDRYGKVTYEAVYSNGVVAKVIQESGNSNF